MRTYKKIEGNVEAVDAVIDAYKDAKELCIDEEDGSPVYRHVNGIGCAIGCLLPPEVAETLPDEAIEYILSSGLYPEIRNWLSPSLREDVLIGLQAAHDSAGSVNDFLTKLHVLREDVYRETIL